MSKPKSYVRLSDGAMMVEVEVDKHQYVNAKVLQAQGRNPAGRKHRVVAGCARAGHRSGGHAPRLQLRTTKFSVRHGTVCDVLQGVPPAIGRLTSGTMT
jgi:hypothetical protein